jgi:ATP-dependent helicase HrpA
LLDYGRDLKKLQAKHVTQAGESFNQIAADELNYTGYIQWAFDDLPEQYSFMQKGQAFIGYPALVDEGETVGVKIFDTQRKAQLQHIAGLIRLFQLHQRKECTYAIKNIPKNAGLELVYNRLPAHSLLKFDQIADYKNDILTLLLNSVFVEGRIIRTQSAFEQSLNENRSQLVTRANEISTIALEIMKFYGDLNADLQKMNSNDPLTKSISEQLDFLIYAGFIRTISFSQFKHLPRYLKAMQYRLDKRDNTLQKANELAKFQIRYWKSVAERSKKEMVTPEQESFRWMLEEFAVSLFAQQLKTAIPVSAQRLDKAWGS